MYIYHAPISTLRAHMIHINLNMIFYTHVEQSPTETIYIKYYTDTQKKHYTCTTHTQWLQQKLGTDSSWDENSVRRGRLSVWL